ncbi:photosystem I assembly protein Ycf3 [Candidatus Nitrosomarinus catalina]|uniref:Photosystem I assembly protein Ycf3 n=1 Tax=Candidatus Nitrosomarinus catalinensis TaxID=1898749 RepID=A0A2Z2HMA7_9ARCH|nr:tetratricopeptide repeat protein [Candidatus Nitrosomarinus catalina]ARS64865.1 photosystem I assembly protein Ycf3 [Candidatus Nitrosomarinus catalina]
MRDISFERRDFTDLQKSIDNESKEELKKALENEKDSQIKEFFEKIESSDEPHKIIEWCSQIIFIDPQQFIAHIQRAKAYHELKLNDQAERCFKDGIKNAESKSIKPIHEFIRFLIHEKRYQDILHYCEKILEIDKIDRISLGTKSRVLIHLREYQKSLECIEKILSNNLNDVDAWATKADALRNIGEYQKSLECFDKALTIDKNNSTHKTENLSVSTRKFVLITKGNVLQELGEYQKSLECNQEVLLLDGNDVTALNNIGCALESLGIKTVAKKYFEKVLKIDENDVIALTNLGTVESCKKALLLDETNYQALINISSALVRSGKYSLALEFIEKGLKINPDDHIALEIKVEILNELQKEIKINQFKNKQNNVEKPKWSNDPATDAQKQYIKNLGGNENAPKTKGEASEMITKLKEGKIKSN